MSTEKNRIEAVYKFAPIIRHGTKPLWWKLNNKDLPTRYNFITNFDYDKDKKCSNNKDNLMKKLDNGKYYELEATVYYSIVETSTHRFITYHFFHPVDQSVYFPNLLWLWNLSHENDGENIQLVIRKSEFGDYIEFLAFESHLSTKIVAAAYFDYIPLKIPKKIRKKVKLFNCDRLAPIRMRMEKETSAIHWKEHIKKYTHPGIYIGSGKHAISIDKIDKDRKNYILFYPPMSFKSKKRFPTKWKNKECKKYEYVLKPIRKTLWSMFINNRHLGNDGVMDGYFKYSDKGRGVIYKKVPRHYNGDNISCILFGFKSNAGILPFAFDLPGKLIKKGRLFFNPASNYKKYLKIDPRKSNWSEKYIYNPYLPESSW